MNDCKNITIVGAGYVGLSLAVAFSQFHSVCLLEIDDKKIQLLKNKQSPIEDELIQNFIGEKQLKLVPTQDKKVAYQKADVIFIATPTNYDENNHYFDTSSIEMVITDILSYNKQASIVIKSTVPIGFTQRMINRFGYQNIVFSPEFLREGRALQDNLYPSRIVVGGGDKQITQMVANLLLEITKQSTPVILTDFKEAESAKLFANTYLAMRVAYFNELDSFCIANDLNAKDIIEIVSSDSRIGNYYNNPSFGYGGYCLPKDSKQLLANYETVPQNLISSIIYSNETRKCFIADAIMEKKPEVIGVYRLIMKKDSDNIRSSAIQDIVSILVQAGMKVIIYEPIIEEEVFLGAVVENDLVDFKQKSDIIISNRVTDELEDVMDKIFTRDIFGEN